MLILTVYAKNAPVLLARLSRTKTDRRSDGEIALRIYHARCLEEGRQQEVRDEGQALHAARSSSVDAGTDKCRGTSKVDITNADDLYAALGGGDKIQDAAKPGQRHVVAGPGDDTVGIREDNTGLNNRDVVNCDKGKQDKGGPVREKNPG